MILILAALAAGFGLATLTYLFLERGGRALLGPLLARGVAWSALVLLVLNVSFPVRSASRRAIVLLDASLSMQVPGGHWAQARDSASRLGDVQFFGDERSTADTAPNRGHSRLAPALTAAAASDRPVVVVTDGELDDAAELTPDLRDRARVVIFQRDSVPDYALSRAAGPSRVTAGDSIPIDLEARAMSGAAARELALTVRDGERMLGQHRIHLAAGGAEQVRFAVSSRGLGAGMHLLTLSLEHADSEPRTDTRILAVSVAPTPGVVLVATPGDWDSRTLFRTLREVAQLPVRGYVELGQGRYRSMSDLKVAPSEDVARAARGADLLVLKGNPRPFTSGARARGLLLWPSGQAGAPAATGDWYISTQSGTPLSGAFLGLPVDSLAPATRLTTISPSPGDWVALEAQDRRRGPRRPAVVGQVQGNRRVVTVAIDGLWRWDFRGGQGEQAYRNLVAAATSWLLAAPDTSPGAARLLRTVVQQGTPLVFDWNGNASPTNLAIAWSGDSLSGTDTLRFDAAGRAQLWLPPGKYEWRLDRGGHGRAAVERYSDELLPRSQSLAAQLPRSVVPTGRSAARDWRWLFGLAILTLALEWWWRRRLGLR